MARSLFALRIASGSVRKELTVHQSRRCKYVLPKSVTGELAWTVKREEGAKERGDEPVPTLEELMEGPLANLKRCRYAKASMLNKVYDACMTRQDLFKAEKLLVAYRHSLGFPRDSLPRVLVRACIRAGHPERAVHYTRNKVQFGVFPSKNVYNILMDACLDKDLPKGALASYDLLLADQHKPDGVTYHLAARASLQLELDRVAKETANQIDLSATKADSENNEEISKTGSKENEMEAAKSEKESEVEAAKSESSELEAVKNDSDDVTRLDLTRALELSEQCRRLEPKLGTKTYRVMVTKLLSEGYTDEAREVLKTLEAENKLPKQTLFNLKLDLCTSTSDFEGALALLKTLCSQEELGMPKEGLPRLREAITATDNKELVNSLEEICTETESKSVSSEVD